MSVPSQSELSVDASPASESGGLAGKTAILWLLALSAVILIAPLYLASQRLGEDNVHLSADVVRMETSLAELSTPGSEVGELEATMTQVQAQIDALDPIYANLSGSHVDWPSTMLVVSSYDAEHLEVTGLTQTDMRLVISGRADSEAAVMAYAAMLEDSGQFERVVVQAITVHATPTPTSTATPTQTPLPTGTPQPTERASGGGSGSTSGGSSGGSSPSDSAHATRTPVPTLTAAPTSTPPPTSTLNPTNTPTPTATQTLTPTATSTPDYRDGYEPDDVSPSQIAVGELQTRSFYPFGDIDLVNVLVKSGRTYQVSTSDLALGVDTLLAVDLNGAHWENDDYQPSGSGDFSSAVCFSAPANATALITISNLAQQYSAARIYKLEVLEVPGLVVSPTALAFGPVALGAANPPPQDIAITGPGGLAWAASVNSVWIALSAAQGSGPSTLTVAVDAAGLQPGLYQGQITITWSGLCGQTIPVSLQVDPASGTSARGFHARQLHSPRRDAANLPPDVPVEFTILVEMRAQQP